MGEDGSEEAAVARIVNSQKACLVVHGHCAIPPAN